MGRPKRKPIVVQSNCLLGACANLTLNENKILKYIISKVYNINDRGEGLKKYKFLVSDLQKETGIGGTCLYTDILKHLKSLRDTSFYIKDPEANKTICTSWILQFSYDYVDGVETNKKYVTVTISDSLQPYLQNLQKCYTKYELHDICKMASAYSLTLFEIYLRELHGLSKAEWTVTLEDFRKMLEIPENKYVRCADLKRRVIDVAIEEINKYTDLTIKCSYIKKGVRVVALKFDLEDSPKSIRLKK